MRTLLFTAVAVLFAFSLAGCSCDLTGIKCENDTHCPPGMYCTTDKVCEQGTSTDAAIGDGGHAGHDAATDTGHVKEDTGHPHQDAGYDAGVDTGVLSDTGVDIGFNDVGHDTGFPDSGTDVGIVDAGADTGLADTGSAGDTGGSGACQPFSENWESGTIDSGKWTNFGSPQSTLKTPGAGASTYAFSPEGDGWCDSGVYTKSTFNIDNGIVVEFAAKAQIYGTLDNDVSVRILKNTPSGPPCNSEGTLDDLVYLAVMGDSGGSTNMFANGSTQQVALPDSDWHKYSIEIDVSGTVTFKRDGAELWSKAKAITLPLGYDPQISIEGRDNGRSGQVQTWADDLAVSCTGTTSNGKWVQIVPSGTTPTGQDDGRTTFFDAVNDRMLFFSGWTGSSVVQETWTLGFAANPNSGAFLNLNLSSTPGSPNDLGIDYPGGRAMMFGGYSGYGSDTEWDQTWMLYFTASQEHWVQMSVGTTKPDHRAIDCVVYDPQRAKFYMYGGGNASHGLFDDLWEFTPTAENTGTWRSVQLAASSASPGKRGMCHLFWDHINSRPLLYGASSPSYMTDLWTFSLNGSNEAVWTELSPQGTPHPLVGGEPGYAHDPSNGLFFIFGGQRGSGDFSGEISILHTQAGADGYWERVTEVYGTVPARWRAFASYDPARKRLIVFGGSNPDSNKRNDTWLFEFGVK